MFTDYIHMGMLHSDLSDSHSLRHLD